jgi:hypothetical protein
MTPAGFRKLALGFDGAIESAHMGHPDFRGNGKIFATLHTDNKHAMVKLTPEQQERFLNEHGAMFTPASGAWGRRGATLVRLAAADEETVGEAMTLAWKNVVQGTTKKATRGPGARASRVRK